MFRLIGSTLAIAALLFGASQAAEAHGNGYRNHESTAYQYGAFHRRRHMPRWLWNKRGFRRWYFRTSLRFNRHLTWRELHDAFRWERRHHFRRHNQLTYGAQRYDNNRYWRDDERRDRGPKPRRRYRDH